MASFDNSDHRQPRGPGIDDVEVSAGLMNLGASTGSAAPMDASSAAIGYEVSMKRTDRNEPNAPMQAAPKARSFTSSCQRNLVIVTTRLPLITQRSLVQIQPPQPCTTRG